MPYAYLTTFVPDLWSITAVSIYARLLIGYIIQPCFEHYGIREFPKDISNCYRNCTLRKQVPCPTAVSKFHIGHGVKQGDVISPLLFNAGLEHAIREWKACLYDEGIHIGAPANLTNIRYADDLMLYAKTWQELVHMLERLKAVSANIGLELNAEKTRIITTASETNIAYIDVDGDMVQVLTDIETHMYLGGKIPADLRRCSVVEVAHRINAAWGKFDKFRYVLTNRHVSIKGRLQLFNAVITPTILFGLGSLPPTKRQLEDIDVLQRKMLRSIVGGYRVEGEAWSDRMLGHCLPRAGIQLAITLSQHSRRESLADLRNGGTMI